MTLGNGLPVIVQQIPGLRSVTVIAAVRGGTRYETPENNGLAHFQEHMFFRGGERYRNEFEVGAAIEGVGGMQNAFTSYEQVAYFVRLPARELALGMDVLSDMLMNARFNPEDIDKERGPVLQEIAYYDDDPVELAIDAMNALLHDAESPLAWRILGPTENIKRFSRADFVSFAERFYAADNMVLAIAGGVSPEEVEAVSREYFSGLKATTSQKPRRGPFKRYAGEARIAYWPIEREQTHLVLAVPAPTIHAPASRACKVLATALGGGLSSRLFIEVRSERGLAYTTRADYDTSSDDNAYLVCYAGVSPKRMVEGVEALVETCQSMATKPDADEVARAKRQISGMRETAVEPALAAIRIVREELLEGGADELDDHIAEHDAVMPDEVTALAEELFRPERLRLAIAGPVTEEMVAEIRRAVPAFANAPAVCAKPPEA